MIAIIGKEDKVKDEEVMDAILKYKEVLGPDAPLIYVGFLGEVPGNSYLLEIYTKCINKRETVDKYVDYVEEYEPENPNKIY